MFRNLFRFVVLIFIAAVVRSVIIYLARVFSGLTKTSETAADPSVRGELKKDPVCGTFVAMNSSIKKDVNGETVHFCSPACRDKYLVA